MKQILGLLSALLIASIAPLAMAEEGGDVCNIRPDLCDEGGGTPEPEIADNIPRARPVQQRRTISPSAKKQQQQLRRKVKPSATARKRSANVGTTKCRKPGQSYNLNDADLPLCKQGISIAADSQEEGSTIETQSVKKTASRSPASVINIDSYLQANANHPAFAKRLGDRQKAFQEQVRPASYSAPADTGVSTAAVKTAEPNKAPESAAPQTSEY